MSDFPPPPGGTPPPPPGGGFSPPPPPGGGFSPPPPISGLPFGDTPAYGYGQVGPEVGNRAGFGIRLGAYLIDMVIVAAFGIPAWIAGAVGAKESGLCTDFDGSTYACDVPTDSTVALILVLNLLALFAGVAYFVVLEGRGATLGKKAVNLRVMDQRTGAPIGPWRALGKYFARILSAIPCFLGYFWMLWDDGRQTWQDKMTSSVVVRDR